MRIIEMVLLFDVKDSIVIGYYILLIKIFSIKNVLYFIE